MTVRTHPSVSCGVLCFIHTVFFTRTIFFHSSYILSFPTDLIVDYSCKTFVEILRKKRTKLSILKLADDIRKVFPIRQKDLGTYSLVLQSCRE